MLAFGVAHIAAIAVNVSATPRECRMPEDSASSARGVAQLRAASVNVVPVFRVTVPYFAEALDDAESCVVAVGQDESPLAKVRRSNLSRSNEERRRDSVTQSK